MSLACSATTHFHELGAYHVQKLSLIGPGLHPKRMQVEASVRYYGNRDSTAANCWPHQRKRTQTSSDDKSGNFCEQRRHHTWKNVCASFQPYEMIAAQ